MTWRLKSLALCALLRHVGHPASRVFTTLLEFHEDVQEPPLLGVSPYSGARNRGNRGQRAGWHRPGLRGNAGGCNFGHLTEEAGLGGLAGVRGGRWISGASTDRACGGVRSEKDKSTGLSDQAGALFDSPASFGSRDGRGGCSHGSGTEVGSQVSGAGAGVAAGGFGDDCHTEEAGSVARPIKITFSGTVIE